MHGIYVSFISEEKSWCNFNVPPQLSGKIKSIIRSNICMVMFLKHLLVLVLVVNWQVRQPLPDCPPRRRQHADVRGWGARYEVSRHLKELIVSASAVSGGNELHSGMVRTMVDLHNGECWSLPYSLCSFLLCEVLVTRAGDLRSNSSGDILKCPFRSL